MGITGKTRQDSGFLLDTELTLNPAIDIQGHTVKPRPEAHMDMILFEVFLKSIDLILQLQILQRHYLFIL